MSVEPEDVLKALVADRDKAYEQLNGWLKEDSAELESLRSQLALAVAERDRYRAGLGPYADETNWTTLTPDGTRKLQYWSHRVHGFTEAQEALNPTEESDVKS